MEVEKPKETPHFFIKNDCPQCGATAEEYIWCNADEKGYTISCNMCPKGSVDV